MEKKSKKEMSEVDKMNLLQEAFASFNMATAELQQSYDELKLKVDELNVELDETNKQLKKNLKEKEELQEYLQNVLENAPNGVVVIDNKRRVKNFNKAAEEITGYDFNSIKDVDIKTIFPQIKKTSEGSLSRKYVDNIEIKCLNGEEKILNVYISKLKDRKKKKIGNIIAFEDVTNIKRLEGQLQRKNRLEAMGEMAAGITHEIRNPLGAIELFASVLKKDIKGEREKEELVENIISGVKSLTNITSNLLLFTKDIRPKREIIDIPKIIEEALIFTEHATSHKKIMLKKEISKNISKISADRELLKQVLLNLVLNAVQAVEGSGKITITARNLNNAETISAKKGNKYIVIGVEDTGQGIEKKNIEKVFNPFFTTRRSGLGLGLAIVHKIISSHNGMIEIRSEKGKGAKFTMILPAD